MLTNKMDTTREHTTQAIQLQNPFFQPELAVHKKINVEWKGFESVSQQTFKTLKDEESGESILFSPQPATSQDEKSKRLRREFKVYGVKSLNEFLLEAKPHQKRDQEDRVARFVVNNQKRLLIGKEGFPSSTIGRHDQYSSGKFFTGGNLFFNQQGKINEINNKTGHLLASFDSIKWALIILVYLAPEFLGFPFVVTNHTEQIKNESSLWPSSRFVYTTFSQLKMLTQDILTGENLIELGQINNDTFVKTITFEGSAGERAKNERRQTTHRHSNRMSLFSDKEASNLSMFRQREGSFLAGDEGVFSQPSSSSSSGSSLSDMDFLSQPLEPSRSETTMSDMDFLSQPSSRSEPPKKKQILEQQQGKRAFMRF